MLCANQIALDYSRPDAAPTKPEADIRLHGSARYVAQLCGPDHAERADLERFIRDVFYRAYGASIRHFMPQLMSLRDADGGLRAVCGLRSAGSGALFLENYLDAPVQSVISRRAREHVLRSDIVEVGNLAVAEPGMAPYLLASVSMYLHGTGAQWAVFTAIPVLRNSLTRLNMQLEILADASLQCIVPAERPAWGSYYDKNPQVMAVRRAARPTAKAD